MDLKNVSPCFVDDIIRSLEYAKKTFIKSLLVDHSVSFPLNATADVMRSLLSEHLTSRFCLGKTINGCHSVVVGLIHADCALLDRTAFQILLMSSLVKSLSLRSFRRIFNTQNIHYNAQYNLSKF